MSSLFEISAALLVVAAFFGWLNSAFLHLPNTIGLLIMGLCASLVMVLAELALPEIGLFRELTVQLRTLDFPETVLGGLLGFLLFAGALRVDLSLLRDRKWVVLMMATVGVVISTIVVAVGFWLLAHALSVKLPFIWALVFGALISPTDPVAVLSTLKAVQVSERLSMDMSGESLFNDGVGVVLFTILLAAATSEAGAIGVSTIAELFFVEAVGGGLLGLLTGYLAYRAMRMIDDYPIEVLISLALVVGTYTFARAVHISGPIAVVVAGLLIGNRGAALAMSDTTQRYLFGFWSLVDEILNSILFLLIGLEVIGLSFRPELLPLAFGAVPIVLLARLFAVGGPVLVLRYWYSFARGTVAILTWGGVRGGISVALALSVPTAEFRPALLAATYAVAIFSIIAQGLTLGWVARRFRSV